MNYDIDNYYKLQRNVLNVNKSMHLLYYPHWSSSSTDSTPKSELLKFIILPRYYIGTVFTEAEILK